MTFQPLWSMLITKMQPLVLKDCYTVVTVEACPCLWVMNYLRRNRGAPTLKVSLSISMHSY